MKFESPDMVQGNIEKIEALFPNCVTETRGEDGKLKKAVNFDLLRQMLSGDVAEGDEAYEFTWVGKKAAIVEANKPIRKTLRPCPEESVNWDTTENLYIEGDNLEVLKLLQESYLGKVKLIYIDPPYNTGNDLLYHDDFSATLDDYEEQVGLFDEHSGDKLYKNTDSNGRFHSNWCSMIYSRLLLSRNILSEDGVIFISIGEEEIGSLISICNEIFSESNCVSKIARVSKTASNMGTYFAPSIDYILCYAKNISKLPPFIGEVDTSLYTKTEKDGPRKGEKYRDDVALYQASLTLERSRNARYYITCPDGSKCIPPQNKRWRVVEETVHQLLEQNMIVFKETKTSPLFDESGNKSRWNLYTKSYLSERQGVGTLPRNYIDGFINRQGADLLKKYNIPFEFAKPVGLIQYLLKICNDKNALIVDFFAGSSTTAHAVMQQNLEDGGHRRFIMIQIAEKCDVSTEAFKQGFKDISEISKERIRRVGTKYKEDTPITTQNLDIGFRVLKLADSNMNDVYYSAGEYNQEMLKKMDSKIKPDRTDLDLLFGCLLDWGLPLSLPYKSETIDGCTVHTYAPGDPDLEIRDALIACFDEAVPTSVIETIARRNPLRAVFREECFTSSPDKINVEEIFKMITPNTRVKVI